MSAGSIFSNAGLASIPKTHTENIWVLGVLNSAVADWMLTILAPTTNLSNGDLGRMPIHVPIDSCPVVDDVESCIDISKSDYDSFETSWDFKRHPLV